MLRAAALLIAAALLSPCASALSACRAAVLDADTGEVCFARNASEHALIASTTKIMTGLLIAEDCDPNAVVTVPQEAVGIEGSSLYLKAGEQLTVRALLYGLLLHSGNDAAVALALAHSGSVGAFVEAMNGRARELGLQDTHFTNPNGLDAPEHYSTALDLARLTRAALQVPASPAQPGGRSSAPWNGTDGGSLPSRCVRRMTGRIMLACMTRRLPPFPSVKR